MRKSKAIHALLGLLGLALLAYMVHRIGMTKLKEQLIALGFYRTAGLVLLYALAQFCFAEAWQVLLKASAPRISFGSTFKAYAAGDAVNMTVPSANLAGEPVKIFLIRHLVPLETAISSVTIYKYGDFISLTIFLLGGWLFHFAHYSLPLAWNIGAGIVAGGMAVTCVLLYLLQRRGIFLPAGNFLKKLGLDEWMRHKLQSAQLIDHGIREFYQRHPGRFAASVAWNTLAWFGGVVEIMIFLRMNNYPASFAAALTVETFSLFINNVTFFVPARIGVGEGGRVLLFAALGYPESIGLSYGIVRRVRELSWIGVGFLIWLGVKKAQDSLPSAAEAGSA